MSQFAQRAALVLSCLFTLSARAQESQRLLTFKNNWFKSCTISMGPSNVDQTSKKGTLTYFQSLVVELPSVQDDETVNWNIEISCDERSFKSTMKLVGGEFYYIVPKDDAALDLSAKDYQPPPDWKAADPDD